MKVISYNVNGIRSALSKNLSGWLVQQSPDVLCLQEIKAQPDQIDNYIFEVAGYHAHWYPAQKKGYSGVAILSKRKPDRIVEGCGEARFDDEGRVLRADYGDLSVISLYMPSGTTGEERQGFKMEFAEFFYPYIQNLLKERPNLIICGDYNICHQAIDIHDPVRNAHSSGFLPEEREWLSRFLEMGMIDSYRYTHPEDVKYSWWSFRAGARERNKGWRIDYNLVSKGLEGRIIDADMLNDAVHSDHCPVLLELDYTI